MYKELKQLLYDEYRCEMSDELFDRFIGVATEVSLKNGEPLIPYDRFDPNVYIHKSGLIRACYFDGEIEKTYGFTNPGTVIISYHPHFMHRPSFFQFESCGESTVMKIAKKAVDELIDSSHEFAKWMLVVQSHKLYYFEFKYSVINGNSMERFRALIENRPEIMAHVPLKIIASYLGITPTHLSRLKKTLKSEK